MHRNFMTNAPLNYLGFEDCGEADQPFYEYVECGTGISTPQVLFFLRNLLTDALLLLAKFGCEFCAGVFGFEYGPEFNFDSSAKWGTLYPLDRFVQGAHLPQPESGNQFL